MAAGVTGGRQPRGRQKARTTDSVYSELVVHGLGVCLASGELALTSSTCARGTSRDLRSVNARPQRKREMASNEQNDQEDALLRAYFEKMERPATWSGVPTKPF